MGARKLSKPQRAMLARLATLDSEESPFGGGRMAKIHASAWHRTAHSLKSLGLVQVSRFGDHFASKLTQAGRDWLVAQGML